MCGLNVLLALMPDSFPTRGYLMRHILNTILLTGWMTLAGTAGIAFGGLTLTNGDFSSPGISPDPFDAWTTTYGESPTDGGGFALFSESQSSALTELEQTFNLPPSSSQLSFEFLLSSDLTGSGSIPPDSFQATLYDSAFSPLLPTISDPNFPAFYSIDATGQEYYNSTLVSVMDLANNWKRVTLNVSSLPSQDVLLEFLLNGSNDARTTTASLDNVSVTATPVPEPRLILHLLAANGIIWLTIRCKRGSRLGSVSRR